MRPSKTDLGREALQSRRAPLDLRQRRALILCDGQRSIDELTSMLGSDATDLVRQLIRDGYVSDDTVEAAQQAGIVDTLTTSTPQPVTPAPTPVARRRSLVAARMYLQDMLALQRNELAQTLRRRLMMAHDEQSIATSLIEALAELPHFTTAGYAARVRERIAELIPEAHLPALQALDTGTPATP